MSGGNRQSRSQGLSTPQPTVDEKKRDPANEVAFYGLAACGTGEFATFRIRCCHGDRMHRWFRLTAHALLRAFPKSCMFKRKRIQLLIQKHDSPRNCGGPPGGSMGGGGGKFIIADTGGGGGARVVVIVLIEGGGGMAVVGGLFDSGFSWLGTFGPILSLSSSGLEGNKTILIAHNHKNQ